MTDLSLASLAQQLQLSSSCPVFVGQEGASLPPLLPMLLQLVPVLSPKNPGCCVHEGFTVLSRPGCKKQLHGKSHEQAGRYGQEGRRGGQRVQSGQRKKRGKERQRETEGGRERETERIKEALLSQTLTSTPTLLWCICPVMIIPTRPCSLSMSALSSLMFLLTLHEPVSSPWLLPEMLSSPLIRGPPPGPPPIPGPPEPPGPRRL